MNRRAFLSFLSVAPVAVPMVAQAMAAKSEAFWVEGVAGEFVELSAEPFHGVVGRKLPAFGRVANFKPIEVRPSDLIYQLNEGRMPLGIAEQFDADLALLSEEHESNLRDTAATHAPVSPDNENEIPTAAPDRLRSTDETHNAVNRIAQSDRRRSWGGPNAHV